MEQRFSSLAELDKRSRDIFRTLVDSYIETGGPVGSRTLSRALPMSLLLASVRNVMSDLEEIGLIAAPHTRAGRIPPNRDCGCSSTGCWKSVPWRPRRGRTLTPRLPFRGFKKCRRYSDPGQQSVVRSQPLRWGGGDPGSGCLR